MASRIDPNRLGPWALITGASAGIGREFARQIAGAGINVVLVARRVGPLDQLARMLADRNGVECRVFGSDLTDGGPSNT